MTRAPAENLRRGSGGRSARGRCGVFARRSLLAALVLAGCARKEKPEERTQPWPAPGVTSAGAATSKSERVTYLVDESDFRVELPGREATPRGRLGGATGSFAIDFATPKTSSGELELDLTKLELDDDPTTPGAETARALAWLELGAEVAPAQRELYAKARFLVHGLEGPAVERPIELRDRRGKPRERPLGVEAFARGELALHGVRAPARVLVSVEMPSSKEPNAHPLLVIRSKGPLVVSLSVHDIRPRDARGVVIARELELLGKTVGREAKVSFELVLRPAPKPANQAD